MPQAANFPQERVIEILAKHGIRPVEIYSNGDILWGSEEIGKEFPVKFLPASPLSTGRWDIFTLRNLIEELEKEDCCDEIEGHLLGGILDEHSGE